MTPAARFVGTFAGRGIRWEWKVDFDVISILNGKFICRDHETFTARKNARIYKTWMEERKDRANVHISRRLVQTNWEPYNDSFGWNKGNGQR